MTNATTTKARKPSAKSNASKGKPVAAGADVNQTQAEQDAALAEIKAKEEAKAQAKAKEQEEAKAKLAADEQAKAELEVKADVGEESKQSEESSSSKPEAVESDKPEPKAEKADSEGSQTQLNEDDHEKLDKQKDVNGGAESGLDAMRLLGAFTVRAKSDAGFWRSGVQFHRLKETLVLVVEHESDAVEGVSTEDHEPERVVCLTVEKAQRVHREPNLTVENIELEELLISPDKVSNKSDLELTE